MSCADLAPGIVESLGPLLVAGFTALTGWLAKLGADKLKASTKSDTANYAASMILRFNDSVATAVRKVEQTYVKAVKAGRQPDSEGGTALTEGEAQNAKNLALAELKAYWGSRGLGELAKVFGLTDGEFARFVDGKIESAVGAGGATSAPLPSDG